MKEKYKNEKWYPYAVGGGISAIIGVILYVAVTNITSIFGGLGTFLGFFGSVLLGCVLAYLMNPLAGFYQKKAFGRMKNQTLSWTISVVLAILSVLVFLGFSVIILIPQLADSAAMLIRNMDGYLTSLQKLSDSLGLSETLGIESIVDTWEQLVGSLGNLVLDNANSLLGITASAGKGILSVFIAFILSIYFMLSKDSILVEASRLGKAVLNQEKYQATAHFLEKCHSIFVKCMVFTLLDSIIIGLVTALFMTCLSMQYVGLISLLLVISNFIPTFGPIIGGVLGAMILLLVNPMHAVIFILFTLAVQLLDGYIIRPKLFGSSLGVSGLLILIAVIVGGNMFGILGMLLAIPAAAILDFIYHDMLLPKLEANRKV